MDRRRSVPRASRSRRAACRASHSRASAYWSNRHWLRPGTGTYLSQDGANGDLTNKQTHGYGLRGTLLAETGTPWGRIAFGPFVRYWNIGESKPAFVTFAGVPVEGFEPHNKTLEAGATLRFHF